MEIIETGEVEDLMGQCKRIRKMTAAMMDGLEFVDKRVSEIEWTLRWVEFRQRHAEESTDED